MSFRDRLLATLRQMQPVLAVLSLLKPTPEMPDPTTGREHVARLLKRLEAVA